MDHVLKYFPELTQAQRAVFEGLYDSFHYWNSRINVISRKDFHNFYLHHVLHSLSIAKVIHFEKGTGILDVGTGGGFPGIPLAVFFPEVEFMLVDSIAKKLKVIESIKKDFQIHNLQTLHARIEKYDAPFDFVVSRAVTQFPRFVSWVRSNIRRGSQQGWENGIFYLKGGDLEAEIQPYRNRITMYPVDSFFEEPFFQEKKILYLPRT